MRLAGTINYPSDNKIARGYVPELVTLHIRSNAPSYTVEQLTGLTGKASSALNFDNAAKSARDDSALEGLLETSRTPGKWHNSIRDAIATMIGRGWPDSAIRFACAPYCEGGAGDADLDELIDGGRKKWGKPDPAASQSRSSTQQTSSAGIPLDYYENFSAAVSKDWIIKGVIAKGETSSWIGPPASGKSALLASVAMCAADGDGWRGYRSKGRVGVVYFALERGQLAKRRLIAHAGPPNLPIAVADRIIDLISPACVEIIIDTIRTAEAHFNCPVGMIIIDTFNKGIAAGGGDEDKAKYQNITAANLRRVHEQTAIHIALIGHTGKDESRGARGSNAHLGDVDMMVQISVDGDIRTATIIMINDGVDGELTRFKLKVVTLGQDPDGDDITTAIVTDEQIGAGKQSGRVKLTKSQRKAMEMLERVIVDEGRPAPVTNDYPKGVPVVSVAQWRDACLKGGLSPAGTEESAAKAFRRAVADLDAMHRIGIWNGLVWIAYE
jgi:energy-coupling factor transporter ATP-binding protein EcfA2